MILINNLSARIAAHQTEIKAATERVISSGWLVLGPEVREFEKAFASWVGTSHCISLANGTDAIELSLKAMDIVAGNYVATTANAGMYTTTALLAIGAEPIYMDVDLDTCCTTLAEVVRAIDAGAKAVVATHLYGQAIPEILAIAQYCAQNNIPLLEDCAQAHGAKINGQYVGTFGDAASFSFYPTKNLGALGDGGAVVTNSCFIAERLALLRQYGWTSKYHVAIAGARNSRLDEMQAAILSVFLPLLDDTNTRRREIAARYSERIQHPHVITPEKGHYDYVAHLYTVRSKKRDALREHLRKKDIASEIHYPIPDYRQPVFGQRFSALSLPNTETLAREILTIPCYPEMNNEEIERVINAINGWLV